MTDISELVVRIKADSSQLDRELKKTTSSVTNASNQMGSAIGGLSRQFIALASGLSVAGLVGFVKQASIAADRLNDLSARTGVAATTLSALELPLKQSGTSAEEFASSINRMNNAIGEAASGQSEAAAQAFTDLGLSIQSLMSMTPEEQFNAIASALNGIQNQAEFTNKGMAIFGRQFSSIAPVIREVNGEIDEFVKRQQELGLSFNASELQMVNDFWDTMQGAIKKAEVSLIRFINNMVNLRSNMREIESDTAIYHAARNQGMTHEQATALKGRVSTTRPDGVDSITFRKSSSFYTPQRAVQSSKDLAKAQEDHNSHLEQYNQSVKEADKKTELFVDTIKDRLSKGLTDAIFDAENAGDAFRRLGDQLARSIFEQSISKPFADAVGGVISSSGIGSSIGSFFGDLLPSFDVGSANVPNDMIAQIHKGERIIPANQNNPAGLAALAGNSGGGVTVNQYFQSGVSRAELQAVLPQVASAAHDAVFASIQKGGSAAKIVGVR